MPHWKNTSSRIPTSGLRSAVVLGLKGEQRVYSGPKNHIFLRLCITSWYFNRNQICFQKKRLQFGTGISSSMLNLNSLLHWWEKLSVSSIEALQLSYAKVCLLVVGPGDQLLPSKPRTLWDRWHTSFSFPLRWDWKKTQTDQCIKSIGR
jgi:hypothetical protein